MKGKSLGPFTLDNIILSPLQNKAISIGAATIVLEEIFQNPFFHSKQNKDRRLYEQNILRIINPFSVLFACGEKSETFEDTNDIIDTGDTDDTDTDDTDTEETDTDTDTDTDDTSTAMQIVMVSW